jgi:5-methyltetrahydropteroyltriglutamate--homocysteine methyltransferase
MAEARILTTHAGSLPRPADLIELILQEDRGELTDDTRLRHRVAQATADVVRRQVQLGIDIPSDGEYSKASYATYVRERLTGFNGKARNPSPGFTSSEFPDFERRFSSPVQFPTNDGPVELRDPSYVRQDIDNLRAALGQAGHDQAFMSSASPGVVETFMPTSYYTSDRAYLEAVGAAMAYEYRAIVDAGFVLQLDCPDLAMSRTTRFAAMTDAEFRNLASLHIATLNRAIDGLPRARTRLHLCWGNYEGPHNHDIPLRDILDVALEANVGALSFEAANPRHAHEWKVFHGKTLPKDLVLIPGVIDTCTNFIEHPELVAQRIGQFVECVGPDRVIAGTDCGFGTSVGPRHVAPSIAWAKLASLVEGAALASSVAG